uniref:Uncharacterized protein n=1 Tax=Anguilla anguilla TaxID=7936 RepID=A0A0E9SR46_ANGAN
MSLDIPQGTNTFLLSDSNIFVRNVRVEY